MYQLFHFLQFNGNGIFFSLSCAGGEIRIFTRKVINNIQLRINRSFRFLLFAHLSICCENLVDLLFQVFNLVLEDSHLVVVCVLLPVKTRTMCLNHETKIRAHREITLLISHKPTVKRSIIRMTEERGRLKI